MLKSCLRCGGYLYMDSDEEISCLQCGHRIYPQQINTTLPSRVSLPIEGSDNLKRKTSSL